MPDVLGGLIGECSACDLRATAKAPVPGCGNPTAYIMLVGEAPGASEDEQGIPFVGAAGEELSNYLRFIGINRDDCYITNVCKCWPGKGNPTPRPKHVEACRGWLDTELSYIQPKIVVALGGTAIKCFLGDGVNVEDTHGRPVKLSTGVFDYVLLPMYHPAAAIHNPSAMNLIWEDMEVLRKVLSGHDPDLLMPRDEYSNPTYIEQPIGNFVDFSEGEIIVAIDTETNQFGDLICVSLSNAPGFGAVAWKQNISPCTDLWDNPNITWVFHNALFDLRVLERAGIHIKGKIHDTMVMAYCLSLESQGLKSLAKRRLGMEMKDYTDIITPTQSKMCLDYLTKAIQFGTELVEKKKGKRDKTQWVEDPCANWPAPGPVDEEVYKDGELIVKTKHPQNIGKKIARIVADTIAGKNNNPYASWMDIDYNERKVVEAVLGSCPIATIMDVPKEEAIEYACRDADATLRLYYNLLPEMEDKGLMRVYEESEIPIIPVVSRMMQNGLPVNRDKLAWLDLYYQDEKNIAMLEAWFHAGRVFNVGSGAQVAQVLFKELGLPTDKRTKGGEQYATDDDVLSKLEHKHPIIPEIIRYRKADKMGGTFVAALLGASGQDDRVHCQLKTTRTATGRLSSSGPNLQNIPVLGEEGERIRNCFEAKDGYVFLSCDLSQIELRVAAHLSQDHNMCQVFQSGGDIHTLTASLMFALATDKIDKEKRFYAKAVNFGILYGMSAYSLLAKLEHDAPERKWTKRQCQDFINMYFQAYPRIKDWIEETQARVRRDGYVADLFGGRRYIPELASTQQKVVAEGLRKAINTPVQGTAARIIKIHMAQAQDRLDDLFGAVTDAVYPLLQIHDDLIYEVKEQYLDLVAGIVLDVMANAVKLSVPVLGEAKYGRLWGSMHELKL